MVDSPSDSKVGVPRWLKVAGTVLVLLIAALVVWHVISGGLAGLHHAPRHHAGSDHRLHADHTPSGAPTALVEPIAHGGNEPRTAQPDATILSKAMSTRPAPTPVPAAGAVALAGCWDLAVREHPLRGRFSFVVEGSALRGTVALHGEQHRIREGVIHGDHFGFQVDVSGTPIRFEGEQDRSELRGTLTRAGQRLSWTARRCGSE